MGVDPPIPVFDCSATRGAVHRVLSLDVAIVGDGVLVHGLLDDVDRPDPNGTRNVGMGAPQTRPPTSRRAPAK
jgi:hypothetical protein